MSLLGVARLHGASVHPILVAVFLFLFFCVHVRVNLSLTSACLPETTCSLSSIATTLHKHKHGKVNRCKLNISVAVRIK